MSVLTINWYQQSKAKQKKNRPDSMVGTWTYFSIHFLRIRLSFKNKIHVMSDLITYSSARIRLSFKNKIYVMSDLITYSSAPTWHQSQYSRTHTHIHIGAALEAWFWLQLDVIDSDCLDKNLYRPRCLLSFTHFGREHKSIVLVTFWMRLCNSDNVIFIFFIEENDFHRI